jgi:hypothetical protein
VGEDRNSEECCESVETGIVRGIVRNSFRGGNRNSKGNIEE